MWHFSVRDTGIGVPASKRTIIFEPFAQADGSSHRQFGGTGLGLAISAQLVEMMGGRLWVDSDGCSGSTFHFIVRMEIVRMSAETAGDERRRHARIANKDKSPVTILQPSLPAPFEVQVLDVSEGGLKFRSAEPLDPGALIHLRLQGEDTGAEVRYCVPSDAGYDIGVKFRTELRG
jgi:hypothetical protein